MKSKILTTALSLALSVAAFADEGMWMVSAGQNFADAVVSLDFGCSGSFVSDKGLIITNHHCAYADVFSLSTSEHNYLENGFWAMTAAEEAPIPGKGIQLLRAMLDVTDEVNALIEEETAGGREPGMRRLSWVMEKRYSSATGLSASLSSMWAGSRYYMALYEEYKDVRLVAAPPVSIAAFGGDIDNWEWPQHKCDFALYRVYCAPDGSPAEYSAGNVPLKSPQKLEISLEGVAPGDSTYVIGYPGKTDRYCSSSKLAFKRDIKLPYATEVQAGRMEIIKSWMDRDPSIRLKYSDTFFGLSNVQELHEGEAACYARFDVENEKKAIEAELRDWIESSSERKDRWGTLLTDLEKAYRSTYYIERQLIYCRESYFNSTRLSVLMTRLRSKTSGSVTRLADEFKLLDLRVEKDLFKYAVKVLGEKVDSKFYGPYVKSEYLKYTSPGGVCDYDEMARSIWEASIFADTENVKAVADGTLKYENDPLYLFFTDFSISKLNSEKNTILGDFNIIDLNHKYTRALYQMRLDKGQPTYPDANSTMRLSRGTVSECLAPRDGVVYGWQSTTRGVLEKYSPDDYDFSLKDDWREMLENAPSMPVDFITDNDITGGNSGSAVVDASGRLVGLAFDGNKESLAGDSSFTPDYTKCVCVDIRFVVWTLRNYAKMDYILEEMNIL